MFLCRITRMQLIPRLLLRPFNISSLWWILSNSTCLLWISYTPFWGIWCKVWVRSELWRIIMQHTGKSYVNGKSHDESSKAHKVESDVCQSRTGAKWSETILVWFGNSAQCFLQMSVGMSSTWSFANASMVANEILHCIPKRMDSCMMLGWNVGQSKWTCIRRELMSACSAQRLDARMKCLIHNIYYDSSIYMFVWEK